MDKGKGRAIDIDDQEAEVSVHPSGYGKGYLEGLNEAQREAVTWNQQGGLQILAGPGSGEYSTPLCRHTSVVVPI